MASCAASGFRWLTDQQFLDAVAVAMIPPGPVVIAVAFIGYLVAGGAGAVVAALGTFVPCYLFTVIPAPYCRRFAKNAQVKSELAVGAELGIYGCVLFRTAFCPSALTVLKRRRWRVNHGIPKPNAGKKRETEHVK